MITSVATGIFAAFTAHQPLVADSAELMQIATVASRASEEAKNSDEFEKTSLEFLDKVRELTARLEEEHTAFSTMRNLLYKQEKALEQFIAFANADGLSEEVLFSKIDQHREQLSVMSRMTRECLSVLVSNIHRLNTDSALILVGELKTATKVLVSTERALRDIVAVNERRKPFSFQGIYTSNITDTAIATVKKQTRKSFFQS